MSQTLLLLLTICFVMPGMSQQIFYVKQDAKGAGSSWEDASGDLKQLLDAASYGDQIWVAGGMYTPTSNTDRTTSFVIKDGIQLYGGFAGFERSSLERKVILHKTTLSGEIGAPGLADNSYSVVQTKGVSSNTIIDGFYISHGNADGVGAMGSSDRCGGGWYNDGSEKPSSPVIINCVFTGNEARDGAGMYNYGKKGNASPNFSSCKFINNFADLDGGGLYNDGRDDGKANPILENCLFEGNKANYGAGIFNYGGGGMSSPRFINCRITKNKAYVRGGGMLNMDVEGVSDPVMLDTSIDNNEASVGNGVYKFSKIQGSGFTIEMFTNKLR